MSCLFTLGLVFALIGCQNEVGPNPSGQKNEPAEKLSIMTEREIPKMKANRQDINKTYQDLGGRPWVLAKPQESYQDINFSVSGNE
ncbi:hypothetical protein N9N55_07520 [Opitutales bacterium]|nr:hypothetical protein [Opitutales bacterium]